MSGKERRVYSREYKLAVIRRMQAGERVSDIARELGVSGARFYGWLKLYRIGGAENLRLARRPLKVWGNEAPQPAKDLGEARRRIGELERKVGQQQVELDFFRRALRQVGVGRLPNGVAGVTASTRSCKR